MGAPLTNASAPTADPADGRAGIAAAIGAAIIYGAAYPATAVALRSFSPLAVAGLSCTLALVLVVALAGGGVLPRTSDVPMTTPRLARLVTLAGLGGVLFIVGTNLAVAISGPTITGFVAPLYAVFATLLAVPLLGERMRPSMVVAFALAFIGTAFLAGTVPTGTPPAGVLLALAAAAMFGLYLVLARRWGRPYQLDGTLITIANLVGRGPILLAVALVTDPGGVVPNTIDPVAVVALLSIVFGSSTSGNLLVMASVRRVRASRTAGALLLTPLASAAIAAVVLGERLSAGGLIGAALILVAMAVAGGVLRRLSRAQRAPA
jgi:drug/metabolite transporter (DMT)-like permease